MTSENISPDVRISNWTLATGTRPGVRYVYPIVQPKEAGFSVGSTDTTLIPAPPTPARSWAGACFSESPQFLMVVRPPVNHDSRWTALSLPHRA